MPTPSIHNSLFAKEQEVYERLLEVAKVNTSKGAHVNRVVVITGLGKDYDDLAAMVVLKELHRLGLIHLEGFITNMKPSRKRAILGRVLLDPRPSNRSNRCWY